MAKIWWRLPFLIYLLPFIPLFFAARFKKYIKEPQDIRSSDASKVGVPKVHYKFSQQVNMPMLVRYCIYYFVITLVIAAISLYIPFRYTNSSTAGNLTSILFLGIMASGFTLNWCLRILKNKVAVVVMALIAIGFLLMVVSDAAVIVGIGILIASYFYGIAQPYYYDRLSVASTRVALTLTLAWFASMDSIGNVVAPFIIDAIAKVLGTSTSTHPIVAFKVCMWITFISLAVVIIRKIIVSARSEKHEAEPVKVATPAVGPTATTAPSANPIPADVPFKKVSDDEMVGIAAKNAVSAAKAADEAAQTAAKAAETASEDARYAATAAAKAADALDATVESEIRPVQAPKPSKSAAPAKSQDSANKSVQ